MREGNVMEMYMLRLFVEGNLFRFGRFCLLLVVCTVTRILLHSLAFCVACITGEEFCFFKRLSYSSDLRMGFWEQKFNTWIQTMRKYSCYFFNFR